MNGSAALLLEFLIGFIAGVAVTAILAWMFREQIKDWMRRRGQ